MIEIYILSVVCPALTLGVCAGCDGFAATTSSKSSVPTAFIVYASRRVVSATHSLRWLLYDFDLGFSVQTLPAKAKRAKPVARFRNRKGRRARIRAAD